LGAMFGIRGSRTVCRRLVCNASLWLLPWLPRLSELQPTCWPRARTCPNRRFQFRPQCCEFHPCRRSRSRKAFVVVAANGCAIPKRISAVVQGISVVEPNLLSFRSGPDLISTNGRASNEHVPASGPFAAPRHWLTSVRAAGRLPSCPLRPFCCGMTTFDRD
jgi:hypothetical protein